MYPFDIDANKWNSVLNVIVGMSGLKFWVRKQRSERESKMMDASEIADVKEKLLEN